MTNWTGDRLKKWRERLEYSKYAMGDMVGIGHIAYNKIEDGYIIPVRYSDELDALHHDWIRNQKIKKRHNPIQISILRELGLDRLIIRRLAA